MGTCQTNNTVADLPPAQPQPGAIRPVDPIPRTSSNPFYDLNQTNSNDSNILSKYSFHSKYKDQFLGDCSVIQEKNTGDLYLCKELQYSNEERMREQVAELEARQRSLTSENVIQIKEVITKSVDGFFGDNKKIFIIIDYPFINFQREIADRIVKKIGFTK